MWWPEWTWPELVTEVAEHRGRERGSLMVLEREMIDRPRDKKRKRKELVNGAHSKKLIVFLREFFPPDLLFFLLSPLLIIFLSYL